jgi:RNA polymerase sigma factor (sigma-70 family)
VEPTPVAFAQAREQFLSLVASVRPELHRYCARLTGSVIEGEDIVQDTLAKAFYALSQQPEVPPLRPWLFRIAHNQALDFLKRHGHKHTEVRDDLDELVSLDDAPEPLAVRAALASFVELPLGQRSALILKDVLGHSLEETAETLGVSVQAVKALLVRGRLALRSSPASPKLEEAGSRDLLERYCALFNARDWDGVRALVHHDCQLDLVSKSQRRGKAVGMYFERYRAEDVTLRVVRLESRLALAAYSGGSPRAEYFLLLDADGGMVSSIRDFRYIPYVAAEADFEAL